GTELGRTSARSCLQTGWEFLQSLFLAVNKAGTGSVPDLWKDGELTAVAKPDPFQRLQDLELPEHSCSLNTNL
uniref:Uncharacterized protein n=1 Tax=Serinus canaria TaxID=9135 RepID=A0A8C9UGV0_SERCA